MPQSRRRCKQRAHDNAVETTARRVRMAGLEPQHKGSKPQTATPTVQARIYRKVQQRPKGWQYPLVGSQVGRRDGCQQVDRSSPAVASTAAATPAGAPYGEQRSGFRGEGGRHHRGCIWNHRSTPLCFASMRRRRFKLWIDSIRCRNLAYGLQRIRRSALIPYLVNRASALSS